jgi:hypothetical protein
MVLISGTNILDISLYFHELCTSALRSCQTFLILDLTKKIYVYVYTYEI